jgi:hypothetical protein
MHPTRSGTVRDFASKLRITAALLGCASQKDLCAQFHKVNPGTTFDLERSYKWMQGRALPRSAKVYEDWATLLGTASPISHLQSCTVDEFLDLVCNLHKVSRDALVTRAGVVIGTPADEAPGDRSGDGEARIEVPLHRRLAGAYACYTHAWSPHFQGKILRGSLAIEAAEGRPGLVATTPLISWRRLGERAGLGGAQLSGPVTIANRSIYLDLTDAEERFRMSMCLFVPGMLASVLAGVNCGASVAGVDPQPAATRILMIRIPGAEAATLETSNRYLDLVEEPLSGDLAALGLRIAAPGELDALLEGFLCGDRMRDHVTVDAGEYSLLALAIDRLFIEHDLVAGVRPLPARARRSSRDTVRLVQG